MTLGYQMFNDPPAASRFLAERPEARLLGGGTILVRRVNEGDISFSTYVRLLAPELKQIDLDGDTVRLGAGVTMSRIGRTPELAVLAPVARSIGGPAIRAAATVGGNLFAQSPHGDFGVALLVLDTVVLIESPGGFRELDIETFFKSRTQLATGSVVTAVRFRRPKTDEFRFVKISRVKPNGAAVLSIAAMVSTQQGRLTTVRVALGAMAGTPVRAHSLETALKEATLTPQAIEQAVAAAGTDASPLSDPVASAWYRKAALQVHLRRLLSTFLCSP